MIEFLVATTFNCHEAQELIDSIKQYNTLDAIKEELIETIKVNTEHQCYEEGSNVLDS